MPRRPPIAPSCAPLSVALLTAAARGQCTPQWSAYPGPILDNPVYALTVWNPDGAGPAPPVIIAGGNFIYAGTTQLVGVGEWDGVAWRPMGGGVGGGVYSATLYDPDGAGPEPLQPVIGGVFPLSGSGQTVLNGVARFDGTAWRPFGTGVTAAGGFHATVYAMTAWNGSLVVGGPFDTAGGVVAHDIALWDGVAWHAFADERAGGPDTLATVNGALYAGGWFPVPNGPPSQSTGILRWDDPTWVTVGQNFPDDDVRAFIVYQGQLFAGGDFVNTGNLYITRFDGANWVPVGGGLNGPVYALCLFDPDGPGPMPEVLFAGGGFSMAGGQPASGIAAWDGTQWSPLGSGTTGSVRTLAVWRNRLVAAGEFYLAGGLVSPGMAFWGCPQPPYCYANCDQSTTPPVLNVSDFACFLNAFVSGSPYANCDGSTTAPVLNIHDFLCFLNKFAAGCP